MVFLISGDTNSILGAPGWGVDRGVGSPPASIDAFASASVTSISGCATKGVPIKQASNANTNFIALLQGKYANTPIFGRPRVVGVKQFHETLANRLQSVLFNPTLRQVGDNCIGSPS